MSPSSAQLAAKKCAGLVRPSIGPYLEVPPLRAADVRRIVSELSSGDRIPTADALNVVTRVSADHAEPMRLSQWPGLLPQLATLVAVGVRWRDEYGERLAARLDTEGRRRGRGSGGSGGGGGGDNDYGGGGGGDDEGAKGAEGGIVWEAPATAAMGRAVTAGYSATTATAAADTTVAVASAAAAAADTTTAAAGVQSDVDPSATAAASAVGALGEGLAGPRTPPELEEAGASKAKAKAKKRRRCGGVDDVSLWADVDEMVRREAGSRVSESKPRSLLAPHLVC